MRVVTGFVVSVLLLGAGGCSDGGPGGDPPVSLTGRVVSLTAESYCVSADRGATSSCVAIPEPDAVDGIEVGECVTSSLDLTARGGRVELVDDAECAEGDLGG